jgi:Holliday junction resolvasome RuvABC ATP-dependent DNA helicase subunit
MEYTQAEKETLIKKYLQTYNISSDSSDKNSSDLISAIAEKVGSVPREIHNLCIKIRDFVITHSPEKKLTEHLRGEFLHHSQIEEGGMTPLHAKYLEILREADRPM